MKNLFYILATVILFSCSMSGAGGNKKDKLPDLIPMHGNFTEDEFMHNHGLVKHYFDSTLLDRGFNGQMLVAKNGTIIYEATQGIADFRSKDSMTAEHPLHVASISKTFTATAILHLTETGRLSLYDSLETFFPGFPYKGINIKMLLSHRSGLPNYLHFLSVLKNYDTSYTNQDVLNALYSLKPGLEYRSGTRFSYSNTNYVLLAMIIEKVTGESYPAYMKRTFFDPLDMQHTFVCTAADSQRITPSFDWRGRIWKQDEFDCTYGDKNIYTTAHDLLKWDQALYDTAFISSTTIDSAYVPLSNEKPSIHNYGLGWRMMNYPSGKKFIYHNGRWHGSNASFVRLIDEKATIIIIGNKYNRNIYSSGMGAHNIFGNYEPGENMETDEDSGTDDSVAKEKPVTKLVSPKKSGKTRR